MKKLDIQNQNETFNDFIERINKWQYPKPIMIMSKETWEWMLSNEDLQKTIPTSEECKWFT